MIMKMLKQVIETIYLKTGKNDLSFQKLFDSPPFLEKKDNTHLNRKEYTKRLILHLFTHSITKSY